MPNRKLSHEGPHKYFQAKFKASSTIIFRCGLTDCSHFLYEPFIIGRLSICWRCGIQFIITKKSVRSKKLHCEDCTRGRYNKVKEKKEVGVDVDKFLESGFDIVSKDEVQNE